MPDKPIYKEIGFWLVVVPMVGGLIIAGAGNIMKPKGKKFTGKLVAKDGKWTIEYTADGKTATTPPFTSTEPGLTNGQEETMWVTVEDKEPTGQRHSSTSDILTIVGIVLACVGLAIFLYIIYRAFREQGGADKKPIKWKTVADKFKFAKYKVADDYTGPSPSGPPASKSFYVY
jgi:hypothetical protein